MVCSVIWCIDGEGEGVLTSSPSRNGMASSVHRTLPTVLFPHPAGPVTTQICCICVGLEVVTPLVPLMRSGMMRALLTVESTMEA